MRRFILASASTARLAVLRAGGIEPEVIVSGVDESTIHAENTADLVGALAQAKARSVADGIEDGVVLGCDSLLDLDGQPHGKPANIDEARERWHQMRGSAGILRTGHALLDVQNGVTVREVHRCADSVVYFGQPSDAEIEAYLATEEPLAVAGGFTLDGLGGWFVDRIDGDPWNVVGVSRPILRSMFAELGLSPVDFWG